MDGIGAFDHISRACMFEGLIRTPTLHGLLPFVRQWYGVQSEFRWVDNDGIAHTIFQGDGGEQGDALMPGLFCLGLHPALEIINNQLPPGAYVLAYLDDIYVACDPDDCARILQIVRASLQEVCHIDVHMGKLRVWGRTPAPCPPDLAATAPTAWKCDAPLPERGLKVLGAPFGSDEYVQSYGNSVAAKREQLLQFLPKPP